MDNSLHFEAEGGNKDSSSWTYKLTINNNYTFKLNFYLRSWMGDSNWSDASVDDWVYDGKFNFSMNGDTYVLNMTDIVKSGTSQANGDWSGPKQIPLESYTKNMSAIVKLDGSCEFKKEKWGVFMKGGTGVKHFFQDSISPAGNKHSQFFEATFSGDTTTESHKSYDDWYVCNDQFSLNEDGTYIHRFTYANHDYDSGWQLKDQGKYSIQGKLIKAGYHTLEITKEYNGLVSEVKWSGFILKK